MDVCSTFGEFLERMAQTKIPLFLELRGACLELGDSVRPPDSFEMDRTSLEIKWAWRTRPPMEWHDFTIHCRVSRRGVAWEISSQCPPCRNSELAQCLLVKASALGRHLDEAQIKALIVQMPGARLER